MLQVCVDAENTAAADDDDDADAADAADAAIAV